MRYTDPMGSRKSNVLFALALTFGVLSIWRAPASIGGWLGYFIAFLWCASLTVSLGMSAIAARLGRTDVTKAEMFARRVFFKKTPLH
jgi:hypothetical protein